jgi:hypothetical protein
MSRLGFLLLLWVFFLPGIKVYGSSETSASVDRMSFNAHWNTPIESMNGTLNLADDYYLTDGTPVTDRNYGEMNNGVLDVTRPNAAHFANRDPRLYSTLFVRGMSWNGKGGEGNWYGGAAASLSMVYVMKYFDPKDTGNSWNNGRTSTWYAIISVSAMVFVPKKPVQGCFRRAYMLPVLRNMCW